MFCGVPGVLSLIYLDDSFNQSIRDDAYKRKRSFFFSHHTRFMQVLVLVLVLAGATGCSKGIAGRAAAMVGQDPSTTGNPC